MPGHINLTDKPSTNTELVVNLMEFSRFGVVSQMFVVDAITQHAARVAAAKPEDMRTNGFVSNAIWIDTARDVRDRINAFYNRDQG